MKPIVGLAGTDQIDEFEYFLVIDVMRKIRIRVLLKQGTRC